MDNPAVPEAKLYETQDQLSLNASAVGQGPSAPRVEASDTAGTGLSGPGGPLGTDSLVLGQGGSTTAGVRAAGVGPGSVVANGVAAVDTANLAAASGDTTSFARAAPAPAIGIAQPSTPVTAATPVTGTALPAGPAPANADAPIAAGTTVAADAAPDAGQTPPPVQTAPQAADPVASAPAPTDPAPADTATAVPTSPPADAVAQPVADTPADNSTAAEPAPATADASAQAAADTTATDGAAGEPVPATADEPAPAGGRCNAGKRCSD